MKKDDGLRVVFFGTPDFATASLDAIMQSPHRVVGVVTVPDKPAGRGRKLKASAVKRYALEKGLPVLQPEKLKDPEFLVQLKKWNADVFVVVAFRILPEEVWKMPPKGTFNLHASLLPDYRGAAPINWAVINGEERTGVTTFFIDDKVDTGEIIHQIPVDISPGETAGSLHDKLMKTGAGLVVDTLDAIARGKVQTKVQRHIRAPHKAPKLKPSNTRIDWEKPGKEIQRLIRGLSPYPGAWTEVSYKGKPQKWIIYEADFEAENHALPPKTLEIRDKKFKIAVPDGWIIPLSIKQEGRKTLTNSEFLNGIINNISKIKIL